MKTIAIIKGSWKLGAICLSVITLALAGFFLNSPVVEANNQYREGNYWQSPSPTPKPSPSPTPTSSPVASPSPTPSVGGNTNDNHNDNNNENENENTNSQDQGQSQNQENNQSQDNDQDNDQTVNVTQNVTTTGGTVSGTSSSVPLKQPDTGLGVLGMASMFSAAPVGFALSRFGRGRRIEDKDEENLAELASSLVEFRQGMSQDV